MKKNLLNSNIVTRYLLNNSSNDKQMIDKIIQDDEKSRKEFEAYLEVWEKSANLKDFEMIDTVSGWKRVRARMKIQTTNKRIPARSYFTRIAAILILALGLAYFLTRIINYLSTKEMIYSEIATTNEIEQTTLPDGSIVSLNKASKIIYNSSYGKSNRDIILEGEAFFDVKRNEKIPFKIHTLNSTIEVLGTSFDVKVDTTEVIVGVLSGKVALYKSGNTKNRIELLTGNTGIYSTAENKLTVKPHFDRNSIAWHTKEFIFWDQPLDEVCRVLANFYHLEFIPNEEFKLTESITFTCSTESLDSVLSTINLSLKEDIELTSKDDLLTIRKL